MENTNNIIKIEKREKVVKTSTEKYYITEDYFYDKLREADICSIVNWDSSYAFKYSRYPQVIATSVDGKELYGDSKEVEPWEVQRIICDAIGVRGRLVIDTFVKLEDDCYCQYVSAIYILKENIEVLQNSEVE